MKKGLILAACLLVFSIAKAQQNVGIGTSTPNASALLELTSTNKGLLLPRMTAAQLALIPTPATGLLVYQTDAAAGFYYNQGTPALPAWVLLGGGGSGTGWNITGNSGTNAALHFLGNTDNAPISFRQNNFWMGRWDASLGNYFIGDSAGAKIAPTSTSNGRNNLSIGDSTLLNTSTGNFNIAFGTRALKLNTTGDHNTALGHRALYTNNGHNNTAIGNEALFANNSGLSNVAIGPFTLRQNTTGESNIAIGEDALYNTTTGSNNVSLGFENMRSNLTGYGNVSLGFQTLSFNNAGHSNVAIGTAAMNFNTIGQYNVGIGYTALRTNTIGNDNVAIGHNATNGLNNLSNTTALGAYAIVENSNAMVLGSVSGFNGATSDVNVGIGTIAPAYKLHVANNDAADGGWAAGIVVENTAVTTGEAALSFKNRALPATRQWIMGLNESAPLAFAYGSSFSAANTRMVIDTLGNVGIGKTAPAAKLDVNGTLAIAGTAAIGGATTIAGDITIPAANDYLYGAPKSQTLNIPFNAFSLTKRDGVNTAGIGLTSISNGLWIEGGVNTVDAYIDAPVYLPAGAIITGLTLWVRDNSATYEVSAGLVEINGAANNTIASVPGTGTTATPGDTFISASGLSVVVSNLKSYYIRLFTRENNGNLRIYNARVNYTIDKVN